MKKLKALLSGVLVGGLLLCVGFTNVNAEEISELNEEVSPSNIPLTINLSPQNVKEVKTSHTVTPKISWYDGVSNSARISYTNAYGQIQLNGQSFTAYNVQVGSTTYLIPSGSTQFSGRHYSSVSSNAGSASMSGTIVLNRR